MKKSNLIIIITSGIIFLTTLFIFIEGNTNLQKVKNEPAKALKDKQIPNFKVLAVNDSTTVHLFQDDVSGIGIEDLKDDSSGSGFYEVKNDTLFIKSSKEVRVNWNNLNSVVAANDAKLMIRGFTGDSLTLKLNNSYVMLNTLEDKEGDSIKHLTVESINSKISLWNFSLINQLNSSIENSVFEIHNSPMDNLNINVKENSKLFLNGVSKVHNLILHKDSLSQVEMQN